MDSDLEQLQYELRLAELCEEHSALLERMAKRYALNADDENEVDALIRVGWIGLITADANFKEGCGVSFISFAILYIRRFMKLYLDLEKSRSGFTKSDTWTDFQSRTGN